MGFSGCRQKWDIPGAAFLDSEVFFWFMAVPKMVTGLDPEPVTGARAFTTNGSVAGFRQGMNAVLPRLENRSTSLPPSY